jgi:ABC-type protease/lipase transport system fused ATPase/permease subunit
MYLIIWIAFLQILFILFSSALGGMVQLGVHVIVGLAILYLAFTVFRKVSRTSCPDRIKRITRTTRNLAVLQVVLGIALELGIAFSWGSIYTGFVSFLHVANALAIITQASSSATAYDMWEEKEFQTPSVAPPATPSPAS